MSADSKCKMRNTLTRYTKAAAYAAGYISLEFAMAVAFFRGLVAKDVTRDGAMAAIGLGVDDVADLLPEGVVIACVNSPKSVTISGDRLGVEETVSLLQESQPGTLARLLKVDVAYHSRKSNNSSYEGRQKSF